QRDTKRAVAAQGTRARQHEVANARQASKGERVRSQGRAEPRHLGESTRDQRGSRVVAEAESIGHTDGDGHDVLERATQFNTHDVVMRVDSELRVAAELLYA